MGDLLPSDTSQLPDYADGETLKPTTSVNREEEALVLPDWGMGKTCVGESIVTDDDENACMLLCESDPECLFMTHYLKSNECHMFSTCDEVVDAKGENTVGKKKAINFHGTGTHTNLEPSVQTSPKTATTTSSFFTNYKFMLIVLVIIILAVAFMMM